MPLFSELHFQRDEEGSVSVALTAYSQSSPKMSRIGLAELYEKRAIEIPPKGDLCLLKRPFCTLCCRDDDNP